MNKFILLLLLKLVILNIGLCQIDCEQTLKTVEELHNLSIQVFASNNFTIDESINKSSQISRHILNQFEINQFKYCTTEQKEELTRIRSSANTHLSRYKAAEREIKEILNSEFPKWKSNPESNSAIHPYLQMLYYTKSHEKQGEFYKLMKDGEISFFACNSLVSREKYLTHISLC